MYQSKSSVHWALQLSIEEAAAELAGALAAAAVRVGHYRSGVLRWEVPLPRGATALQWLQVC